MSQPEPTAEPETRYTTSGGLAEPESALAAEHEPIAEAETMAEPEPEIFGVPMSQAEAKYVSQHGVLGEPTAEALEGAAEAEAGSVAVLWSTLVLYALTIALILCLNSLILAAVFKGRLHKSNVINIYLISLIVSRMSIGVLVIPARITGLFSEEYLGNVLCKMCHFFAMGSGATSVFSTTAIAIVKFREIVLHRGVISVTFRRAVRDAVLIWLCGHVYAIRAPVMNSLMAGRCAITDQYRTVNGYLMFLDLALLFVAPLCIVVYCYIKVINYLTILNGSGQNKDDGSNERPPDGKVKPKQATVHEKHPPPKPVNAWGTSSHDPKVAVQDRWTQAAARAENAQQKRRSIDMILAVISLFFICSILPYVPRMYAFWSGDRPAWFPALETTAYLLSYSNPWINALVIMTFRPDIRRALRYACTPNKVGSEESLKQILSMTMNNRDILLRTD